jgi:hypothetical protein
MVSWSTASIISPYSGHQWGYIGSVWKHCDWVAGEPPGGHEQLSGVKLKCWPPGRSVQSEDAGSMSKRDTYQDGWILPRAEAHQQRGIQSNSLLWGLLSLPESQAPCKYELSCCLSRWLGPYYPEWGWFFGKWRLDSVPYGRTSLAAALSTGITGLSWTPSWWKMVCWSVTGSQSWIAQTVLTHSKATEVMGELHGGPSGEQLGVTEFCTKLDSGITGYIWEATWRDGANNVTLAGKTRSLNSKLVSDAPEKWQSLAWKDCYGQWQDESLLWLPN